MLFGSVARLGPFNHLRSMRESGRAVGLSSIGLGAVPADLWAAIELARIILAAGRTAAANRGLRVKCNGNWDWDCNFLFVWTLACLFVCSLVCLFAQFNIHLCVM